MTPAPHPSDPPASEFHSALEMMPMPAAAFNANGEVTFFNRRWMEFTGMERPGSWQRSIHPDDLAMLEQRVDSEAEFRIDVRLRREDGSYRWHLCQGIPAAAADNGAGIVMFTDVHELRSGSGTDNASGRLMQQLVEKEAALEASNRELQQFAYVTSHDLQEPLRMVGNYTALLARKYKSALDQSADEYIAFILEGVGRMGDLIRDLLTYSRAATPPAQPLQRVSVTGVVQWATMTLQAAIQESGAEISYGPLPDVSGDEIRLAQLWQHLIGNAIKFRSAQPPRVRITAERQGEEWLFCVADNGIGFEMKFADRIFGVFKRLQGREYPGNGIGLAIASKIVHQHGGRIWAESEPRRGSQFYFTIPAED